MERIKNYTQEREPRYRPLIEHKTAELENISGDISNEGLDQEYIKFFLHGVMKFVIKQKALRCKIKIATRMGSIHLKAKYRK